MPQASDPKIPAVAAEAIRPRVFVSTRSTAAAGVYNATAIETDVRGLVGFAPVAAAAGRNLLCYGEGDLVRGFSGLTPGAEYWLSGSGVALYADITAEVWTRLIGVARDSSSIQLHFGPPMQAGVDAATSQAAAEAAQADATQALADAAAASAAVAAVPRVANPLLAGGFTPASGWAFHGEYLVASPSSEFTGGSDALNQTPAGWTGTLNSGNLSAGPSFVAANSRLEWTLVGSTAIPQGTAPHTRQSIPALWPLDVCAFLGSDAGLANDKEQCYLCIAKPGALGSNYFRVGPRNVSGTLKIESRGNSSSQTSDIVTANVTAGAWYRIVCLNGGKVRSYYNLTAPKTADPRSIVWTLHLDTYAVGGELATTGANPLTDIGILGENGNASQAAFSYWCGAFHYDYLTPAHGTWGAKARSTSPFDHTFPEANLGSSSAVFGDTEARALAVSLTNRRPQDTPYISGTSTVLWRFTRGETGLSGSGSWYAPDAVVVQGTGPVLLMEVRGTSDGASVFSVRLNVPVIPGAA